MDLIERQAAIDAVRENTFRLTFAEEQNCEGHVAWSAEAVYSDVIEGALLELPPAQPEQRWIPCSERLPFAEFGESDNVLTTCGYRDVKDTSARWIRLLYFNGGNWCYPTGETYEQKVYAWMPLPDPAKLGGD